VFIIDEVKLEECNFCARLFLFKSYVIVYMILCK